jgi:energy-converting hydrogenase Eha subunit C
MNLITHNRLKILRIANGVFLALALGFALLAANLMRGIEARATTRSNALQQAVASGQSSSDPTTRVLADSTANLLMTLDELTEDVLEVALAASFCAAFSYIINLLLLLELRKAKRHNDDERGQGAVVVDGDKPLA